jgi:hypothetical protein
MAKTFADYVAAHNLKDSQIPLLVGGHNPQQYDLDLPAGATDDRAILAWTMQAVDPDDLKLSITMNGHPINTYTVGSDVLRTIHEVVEKGVLNVSPGQHNKAEFKLLSGDGTMKIADVVLWFQRHLD